VIFWIFKILKIRILDPWVILQKEKKRKCHTNLHLFSYDLNMRQYSNL